MPPGSRRQKRRRTTDKVCWPERYGAAACFLANGYLPACSIWRELELDVTRYGRLSPPSNPKAFTRQATTCFLMVLGTF